MRLVVVVLLLLLRVEEVDLRRWKQSGKVEDG